VGPIAEGEICDIELNQNGATASLTNVLFGDVYVCSGQSNMEWSMGQIFNATEEVAASAEYTNIRMYRINYLTSDTEQDDLISEIWDSWSEPTDVGRLNSFSAICFLYARGISQKLSRRKVKLRNGFLSVVKRVILRF
jgi:sialate O-acetylesterase